ncbi:MAG: hypothetical protein GXY51_05650 [Bacteroidetes bacterium]|nr:hypothetical protein [Bacteroidota bacterium]
MAKYLNIGFFIIMLVMNYLANALPLNNKTTGQLSDSLPNLFVPAGITFSIWGLIYLLLIIYCIIQFTASDQQVIDKISWLFGLSCMFNALWIVVWHYQKVPLSVLVMAGLLVTLIVINIHIKSLSYGLIKVAFGIYLGWICIATIANITALLVYYNWNGFGMPEATWTIIMIITGALLVSVSIVRLNNPYIGLAVIWAFTGIFIKRQEDYRTIAFTAIAGLIIVSVITLLAFLRKNIRLF